VLVLEQADAPGMGATSQNSGMIRRMDPEPCDRALAQRTHHFLTEVAPDWGKHDLSQISGAVLGLVRDPLWLNNAVVHLRAHGVVVEQADPGSVPALEGSPLVAAWSLPEERVTHGPSLVNTFLERAQAQGAVVRTRSAVHQLLVEQGRCIGVMTAEGPIHAGTVVLAGGAWCGRLAADAGLQRPLIPLRRMVGVTAPDPISVDTHPWCWLDDVGCYIRPRDGAWLASPCDEVPEPPPPGAESTGSPTASQWQLFHDKVLRYFPRIGRLDVSRGWTGLRTYAPDRRPLLGADPELPGLWWAAGLGGSGLSSSWGVGEALAAWFDGQHTPWLDATGVDPGRSQLRRWPILPDGDPGRATLISGRY
jgi:D-arginine dehydrogenase